jgi:hypothetical protein
MAAAYPILLAAEKSQLVDPPRYRVGDYEDHSTMPQVMMANPFASVK